jgi:sigma-E factor negative regulatory protein RseB
LLSAVLRAAGGSAALCLAAQVWAAGAAVQDDPRDWLARTDEALSNRNYEGVFVHEHAGETETLRVIHRVDGEGVSERLLSMDGSGREFIRKGAQLICYLPDQHIVLVEKTPDAALLLTGLPRIDASAAGQYGITELARARVSGRDARVIAIAPTDQLRYGYRVWIDEGTAMPLKTQLRDSHGGVLEQIVFTSLKMLVRIPRAELEPAVDAHGYRWIRRESESVDSSALTVSWEANTLPAGFRMTASARQILPSGPVEHLVFSDGLASVSVFVEIGRAAGSAAYEDDAATLGTSSAYSTVVQGYRVTAVGEVPPETVRVIARAIHNAGPDAGAAESVSGTADATAGVAHGLFPTADSSGPPAAAGPVRGFGAETPGFGTSAAPIFSPPSRAPTGGSGRR